MFDVVNVFPCLPELRKENGSNEDILISWEHTTLADSCWRKWKYSFCRWFLSVTAIREQLLYFGTS